MSDYLPGLVSAVIPVHNRAGLMKEAVASRLLAALNHRDGIDSTRCQSVNSSLIGVLCHPIFSK
jgi:hypothetical protein